MVPVAILTALLGTFAWVSAAGAAEQAWVPPMRVKLGPLAGTKVKVAKDLKVVASCTKDCSLRARIKLITPVGNSTVSGGRRVPADRGWITGMVLTRYGLKILRTHYRQSRLKVSIAAKDLETGRIVRIIKSFRFRR